MIQRTGRHRPARRPRPGGAVAVLAALAALAFACGEEASQPPAPFTATDGATLYSQACARCHGPDLQGAATGPPFINDIYRPSHHADQSFLLAVRAGVRSHHWDRGNMPPIAGLSDSQVMSIVGFVRARQRAAGVQ